MDNDRPEFNRHPNLDLISEVISINYQRNGVSGVGFYSVIFIWKGDNTKDKPKRMLGVLFDCCVGNGKGSRSCEYSQGGWFNPHISIMNLDAMAMNDPHWDYRGDNFYSDLYTVCSNFLEYGFYPRIEAEPPKQNQQQSNQHDVVQQELDSLVKRIPTLIDHQVGLLGPAPK